MTVIQRRIVTFIGCVLAASALTSCSMTNGLAVFDEPQAQADTIPPGATPNVVEDLDADTTRLLWTDAGLSYYAARSGEGDVCLVIVDDLEAVSGCFSTVPIMVQGADSTTMMLAESLPDNSEEWTKVAEHLWAAT